LHQEVKEDPEAAKVSADVFERIQRVENLLKPIFAEGSIRDRRAKRPPVYLVTA
jgi:hypothetical protein